MKHLLRLLASLFVVTLFSWSTVANGQITSWDLADGLRASIPDPDNLATAMNPVQVGTATWGFRAGGGQPHYTTAVKGPSSVGGSNVELPHDGVMWWNGPDAGPFGNPIQPAAASAMAVFDSAAAVPGPCSNNAPCTNYQAGDVGGFGFTGAVWTTDVEGDYRVTWGGYAGREVVTNPLDLDMLMIYGSPPFYDTTPPTPGRMMVHIPFENTEAIGAASAFTDQIEVHLLAGDAIDIYINGNDWVGLQVNIECLSNCDTGGVLGDYSNDGMVNAADYTVFGDNEGQVVDFPNRDPTLLGTPVGAADYMFWRDRFGNSGVGSGSATRAAVPEPTTFSLSLLVLSAFAAAVRGNCRRDGVSS